jgi:frataxin-like iron-binding protein CyaY
MKDLAELSADDAEFAALADEILPEIEKLFDSFKAQCEYVGPRDESGKQVGEVKVSVNSDGTADLTEAILAAVQAQTEGSGAEFDIQTANFTIKMRGEGKLMWDLAGGHAESFEMDSEVELLVEIAASVSDPNGGDHTVEANVEFAAHMKWSME